jgi:hypothetical protein
MRRRHFPRSTILPYIMSDNASEAAYWHRVDAFINQANELSAGAVPDEVGASFLYAAARFNAFLVAKTVNSTETMALEKERALEYFTEHFRKMLASNLEDFTVNYDKYMKPGSR